MCDFLANTILMLDSSNDTCVTEWECNKRRGNIVTLDFIRYCKMDIPKWSTWQIVIAILVVSMIFLMFLIIVVWIIYLYSCLYPFVDYMPLPKTVSLYRIWHSFLGHIHLENKEKLCTKRYRFKIRKLWCLKRNTRRFRIDHNQQEIYQKFRPKTRRRCFWNCL